MIELEQVIAYENYKTDSLENARRRRAELRKEAREKRERRRVVFVKVLCVLPIVLSLIAVGMLIGSLLSRHEVSTEIEYTNTPETQNATQGLTDTNTVIALEKIAEQDPLERAVSIGECKITHYCCELYPHICGTGDGITATGTHVRDGVVAVDPDVIPLGSDVYINGTWYKAEDTGGGIKGNRVDVAVATHNEALQRGIYTAEVLYIATEGQDD